MKPAKNQSRAASSEPKDFKLDFYENETFEQVNNSRMVLEDKEFYHCIFRKCDFQERTLLNCYFENCQFENSNLAVMKIKNSAFSEVVFKHSNLTGINWEDAKISLGVLTCSFSACRIDYASFMEMDLSGINIIECMAREVNFEDANLSKADFSGTDLTGSRFVNSNLARANFSRARNYTIDPTLNTLKKTRFALPEAMSLLHGLDILLEE